MRSRSGRSSSTSSSRAQNESPRLSVDLTASGPWDLLRCVYFVLEGLALLACILQLSIAESPASLYKGEDRRCFVGCIPEQTFCKLLSRGRFSATHIFG